MWHTRATAGARGRHSTSTQLVRLGAHPAGPSLCLGCNVVAAFLPDGPNLLKFTVQMTWQLDAGTSQKIVMEHGTVPCRL